MLTICKADWCGECTQKEACGGCAETDGHPFLRQLYCGRVDQKRSLVQGGQSRPLSSQVFDTKAPCF